jgi:hypothetical protein
MAVAAGLWQQDKLMCSAAAVLMNAGQPFYPASWSNEDIWRALLGLQPLPSELVDIVGQAAPGEKAYMKKVWNVIPRI